MGGVNVITDDFGSRVQLIEYDPWGKVSREEGIGDSVRRFTGHMLDPESGLYYYGGRYYDPELGRFISPDPFVGQPDDPQNLNRYSYVVNNPVNYIDPDGYFHQVKKKKKKGGLFGKIFSIFQIVAGAVGVFFGVPPIVIGEINFAPVFGFLNIAQGIGSLASGRGTPDTGIGGLGARGPPFGGEPGDFGLLSTMAGNDHPSPALDFWQLASAAVQIAQQLGGDRSSGSGNRVGSAGAGHSVHHCIGIARVLRGNPRTVGKAGGFGTEVTAESAAIIPEQFGVSRGTLRPHIGQISGRIPGGQTFSGVSDIIGGRSPIPGMNVRDALQVINPGAFIVELIGAPRDFGVTEIELTLPSALPCPTGTQ